MKTYENRNEKGRLGKRERESEHKVIFVWKMLGMLLTTMMIIVNSCYIHTYTSYITCMTLYIDSLYTQQRRLYKMYNIFECDSGKQIIGRKAEIFCSFIHFLFWAAMATEI